MIGRRGPSIVVVKICPRQPTAGVAEPFFAPRYSVTSSWKENEETPIVSYPIQKPFRIETITFQGWIQHDIAGALPAVIWLYVPEMCYDKWMITHPKNQSNNANIKHVKNYDCHIVFLKNTK